NRGVVQKSMAFYANRFDSQSAAEKAVSVIGSGYDLSTDIRLSGCKPGPSGSSLIELDQGGSEDLVLPGGVVVPNVRLEKVGKWKKVKLRKWGKRLCDNRFVSLKWTSQLSIIAEGQKGEASLQFLEGLDRSVGFCWFKMD
ncbi:hypothetical protein U1Q18_009222, partial [Sarracenia purpurea var. burkii]